MPEFSRDLLFDLVVSPLGFGEKTAYNSVQVIEAFSADPTFITLTDTHIGFPGHPGIPGTPWPPAPNIDEMSKLKQEIDEINLIHPDFVVITGDLVDYGGSTEDHENWEDFENLLRLFEVPVYTVTGNHDWYADDVPCIRPEDDELDAMGYYFRNISPYMDYTFDYGDLHAVCLNSGYQGALLGSGSSGLEDLQIEWLSDDLAGNPDSFIFLHHPVVRAGGIEEHTLFTNNREEFMTVCENNAVEAVFSGHDHSDEHISESGVDYYLTRSATRSNEDNGYRIIRPTGSGAHEEMVLDNYNESLGEYNLNLTYSPLDWDVGTAETLHATIVNRHTGKAHLSSDLFPDMLLKFIMPRGSYEVSATTSPSIWTPEPEDADCEIIAQTDYADRSLLHVIVDVRDAEPTQVNPFEWEYLTTVNVTVSPVEEPTSAVDVVLIIDSSGSMGWNDPGNKRLEAARAYLTASLEGDHVGVVDFDGYVRVASDLRRLPDEKTSLIAAINTINSSGATNIGRGIQAGCDVLLASTSGNAVKAAILLTDGQGSFSGQDECFKSRGWPIYTFGFGDANRALLQQIASNTGGEYTDLPTSDFVCEFQRVRAKIAGVEPGPCTAMHIDPIETETFFAAVPPSMAIATFSTSWIGSDVVMTLTTPSGRVVDRSTVAPDVIHDKGAAFETYTILNPEPGDWQVDLFGADVPPGGEEVVFGMSTVPALNAPPVADADGPYAAEVGVAVNVRGSFNDPDFLDTHTATWDWGDTTTSAGTVTEVGGSGNVTGSHTYECLGVYTITLAVTDDDGDVGTATTTVTVEPRPMDSFNVNNLTVRWYTNGGPLRPDTFGIRGTLELPDGYWADDLIKEAEVTVAIGGEVGIDNVSDFTEYRPPSRWPQTVRWYYSGNEQPPGDGINITRMTINFPPEGTDWSGWPNFEIVGQLELPDHVGPGTEPPEVTVTLEIQATPCGSVIGGDTVLSRVYRFMGYWYNWTYRE